MRDVIIAVSSWSGVVCAVGVYATLVLTARRFHAQGSVGQTTPVFFLLSLLNAATWVVYGSMLGSPQIMLPNAWGLACATYALRTYLLVLARTCAHHALPPPPSSDTVDGIGGGGAAVPEQHPQQQQHHHGVSAPVVTLIPTTTESHVSIHKRCGSGGGGNGSGTTDYELDPVRVAGIAITAPSLPPPLSTDTSAAAHIRLAAARSSCRRILGGGAAVLAIAVLLYGGLLDGYATAAVNLVGTTGVCIATVMFAGPLDQVGWIVRNRCSAPLSPLTTVVGVVNGLCWSVFGLLVADPYVYAPNIAAVVLCLFQLGLILRYPQQLAHVPLPTHAE